ncbi:TetR/AcrR family transcriptional regulator [Rhizohabitans arisaemae]|uniref:TetR/AcrR family transcriptional regulator n=1 Tax=Rhizohabitans arisaemae TaxID=2720610 RepID=UPI0024B0A890|nr:TetR/AcrR family transcriptional regulator [Rhizohabitans arisaemae]
MRGTAKGKSRPKDRRAQILRTAATLFHDRGYHGVGVDEIAAALGISGPALYRHFRGKHDLLWHAIDSGMAAFEAVRSDDLDTWLDAMVTVGLDGRDFGALWQREVRNLNEPERAEFRRRLRHNAERTAELLRGRRPDLGEDDARLLAWAITAVVGSPAHHHATPENYPVLLRAMVARVAGSESLIATVSSPRPALSQPRRASTREALLAAATRLFSRYGFAGVSNDDIGAAVGVTGPTLYKHFASKTEILTAALNRGDEALKLALDRALSRSADPPHALAEVVTFYVDFATHHPDLIGVLISEVTHLPAEERQANRRRQRQYVAEWTRLLRQGRPALSEPEALAVVHCALTVINDLVRLPLAHTRADLTQELTDLALEILHAWPPPPFGGSPSAKPVTVSRAEDGIRRGGSSGC